jgi:hypothetical protein
MRTFTTGDRMPKTRIFPWPECIAGGVLVAVIGLVLFSAFTGETICIQDGWLPVDEESRAKVKLNFQLHVLVDGERLPSFMEKGQRWVEAQSGQEYQILITNPDGMSIHATTCIDGVNVVSRLRCTNGERGLQTESDLILRGFRLNHDEVEAYVFARPDESLARRLGITGYMGDIRVDLYVEKPPRMRCTKRIPDLFSVSANALVYKEGAREEPAATLGTRAGRRIPSPLGFGGNPFDAYFGPVATLRLRYRASGG